MYVFKHRTLEGHDEYLARMSVDPDDWQVGNECMIAYECLVVPAGLPALEFLDGVIAFADKAVAYQFFAIMVALGLNIHAFDIECV